MNLFDELTPWRLDRPNAVAVRDDDSEVTRSEFDALVRATSVWLSESIGVGRGDRVAYLGLNRVEQLAALYACSVLGAALVVCNWRSATHELRYVLADASPKVLIGDSDLVESFRADASSFQIVDRVMLRSLNNDTAGTFLGKGQLGDVMLIIYTSGTTGQPKGAMLTQRALSSNAQNSAYMFGMSADDHVLNVLPMFHVGGLNIQTTPALQLGVTVTLHSRFEAGRWLADVERLRPTTSVLVPAMMSAVLAHPEWPTSDLSSLTMVGTGSTFVPVPLIEAFHERGVVVGQVYGSTETAPIVVCQDRQQALAVPGATGTAAPLCALRIVSPDGIDVAIGDPGELWVKGPNVFSGYWNRPDESAAVFVDGWYRTGDIGFVDTDGQVRIADRLKDMIISGGENIYPAALEAVLMECPDIAEAAVVGRPDEKWGEVPVAFVVPRVVGVLTVAHVLGLFEGRVGRYAQPRHVVFLTELPRNSMGKVLKAELRARRQSPRSLIE